MAVNLGRNEEQFTMASGDLFKGEVKQNLREVFELQTQRVHIWNEFDLRFKEYTLDAPSFELKKLQLICKEIGEQLNSVSMQIIRIKEKFSSDVYNVKSLYELLEQLQSNEQMKFQLVSILKKMIVKQFYLFIRKTLVRLFIILYKNISCLRIMVM
jgi:hypothetical protein